MGMNRLNRHVMTHLDKKTRLTAGKANRGDVKIITKAQRNGSLLRLEEPAPPPPTPPTLAPTAKKKTKKKKSTKK
jgi:hypothetical protein